VRKATTAGKDELLRKAMFHGFEKVSAMIRKLQDEGKSVTQYYHIYNLAGFNIYQHGCPRCKKTINYKYCDKLETTMI